MYQDDILSLFNVIESQLRTDFDLPKNFEKRQPIYSSFYSSSFVRHKNQTQERKYAEENAFGKISKELLEKKNGKIVNHKSVEDFEKEMNKINPYRPGNLLKLERTLDLENQLNLEDKKPTKRQRIKNFFKKFTCSGDDDL